MRCQSTPIISTVHRILSVALSINYDAWCARRRTPRHLDAFELRGWPEVAVCAPHTQHRHVGRSSSRSITTDRCKSVQKTRHQSDWVEASRTCWPNLPVPAGHSPPQPGRKHLSLEKPSSLIAVASSRIVYIGTLIGPGTLQPIHEHYTALSLLGAKMQDRIRNIGVGAQSTLGEQDIFARKLCMKN